MATTQSPVIVKKKGFGCCGCGCFFLGLLVLLFVALVAGCFYEAVTSGTKFTSGHPANIPIFDSGDEAYNATIQKLNDFNHDIQSGVPASLHLSADEINTLIAHNPDFTRTKIRAYVALNGDQAEIKSSLPTDLMTHGYFLQGRYLNSDATFGLNFAPDTKTVGINLKSFHVGGTDAPANYLAAIETGFNAMFDRILKNDPSSKSVLDKISSIRIEKSDLVLDSK